MHMRLSLEENHKKAHKKIQIKRQAVVLLHLRGHRKGNVRKTVKLISVDL